MAVAHGKGNSLVHPQEAGPAPALMVCRRAPGALSDDPTTALSVGGAFGQRTDDIAAGLVGAHHRPPARQ